MLFFIYVGNNSWERSFTDSGWRTNVTDICSEEPARWDEAEGRLWTGDTGFYLTEETREGDRSVRGERTKGT